MLNANAKHKKIPQVYSLGKTEASSSTQTESNVVSTAENCEKETSCLTFVQPNIYQFYQFFDDIKFFGGRIF